MNPRNISRSAAALLAPAVLLAAVLLHVHDTRREDAGQPAPIGLHTTIITGRVVKVADGDSLVIRTSDKKRVEVRLFGIDAPEGGQAFGNKSRDALKQKIGGRNVEVHVVETDQYGRLVGDLYHDGTWINEAQVAQGWAWHYTHYSGSKALARAEREARTARRGLWRDARPTPPWLWRRKHPRAAAPVRGGGSGSRQ